MTIAPSQVIIPVPGAAAVQPLKAGDALRLYGATSGYAGFAPAAAAGSTVWELPAVDGTNGQVLSTNGSAKLAWTTAASGITIDSTAITGGAANRILFQNGAGQVSQSANLTWDGTQAYVGGKLGINKSAPGAQLHTVASSATTVGSIVELAAAQTANAIEVNSSGGSGGNLFRVTSAGGGQWVGGDILLRSSSSALTTKVNITEGIRKHWELSGGEQSQFVASGTAFDGGSGLIIFGAGTLAYGYDAGGIAMLPASQALFVGSWKSATPTAGTISGTLGSGTDIAGAALNLAGGQGTGTGASGVLNLQTAPAGTTGTSLNALVTVAQFDASTTATHTRFLIYDVDTGLLSRVTVGANDSGGAGFKVLRIPN